MPLLPLFRSPAVLAAIFVAPLLGQTPTDRSSPETDEDGFELSPFLVETSGDVGYLSNNSVSATGLNTPIRDLPMTVQVVNQELITDLGATDLNEALSYSSGVFTSDFESPTGGGGPDANRGASAGAERSASASARSNRFANQVRIRGFDVPFQNRMGFRVGGLVITPDANIALGGLLDASNIERMEVVKGPNSLLYGIGVLSGIVNVIPERPLAEPRASFRVQAGSYDFYRGEADLTGPIFDRPDIGELNVRVAGALEERGDWTDWRRKEVRYLTGQMEWNSPKRRWNLFLEAQWGNTRYEGTGSQWIYDTLSNSAMPGFRDEYGQQYSWAEEDTIVGLGKLVREVNVIRPGLPPQVTIHYANPDPANRVFQGGSLPIDYRITGPDTYEERDEYDFLANLIFTPTQNLSIAAGVYYVTQESEEFDINLRSTNNREAFNLRQLLAVQPEADTEGLIDKVWGLKNVAAAEADDLDLGTVTSLDDLKVVRYWWTRRPQSSDSIQAKLTATYSFETPFIRNDEIKHTLLAGYHFIGDDVDFLDGNEGVERALNLNTAVTDPGADALYFRALDDFSVARYEGENLAMPGDAYRNQEISFHGAYAIWNGKFFRERLQLLAGFRYDRYNASTATYQRTPDGASEGGYVNNPTNRIYGISPHVDNFPEDIDAVSKLFAANFELTKNYTIFGLYSEGLSPNTGLTDGNNKTIPAERTAATELGIKFDLLDGKFSGSVAAYRIRREDAIWEFRSAPSPSKWAGAPNPPIGFSESAGQFDPDPDGEYYRSYGIDSAYFNPVFVDNLRRYVTQVRDENTKRTTYFLNTPNPNGGVIRQELPGLVQFDRLSAGSQPLSNQRFLMYLDYDQLDGTFPVQVYNEETDSLETVQVNWREGMEGAFFDEVNTNEIIGSFDPIRYLRIPEVAGEQTPGNMPTVGTSSGANVTFTDVATGVDVEFVWTPSKRFQLIFNYAHTERSAEGAFEMVDYVDLASGREFAGTEYDAIVRIFGREAFGISGEDTDGDGVDDSFTNIRGDEINADNPVRPSDAVSGIDGLSLFFNPEDQASLWSKYTFIDGPLEGIGLGFGAKYSGPSQTSIAIGGTRLTDNPFRTPDTPSRTWFDAALYYSFTALNSDWRLALNVYNLFDDRTGLTTISYDNPVTGGTELRKTELHYTPRTFRVSASVSF